MTSHSTDIAARAADYAASLSLEEVPAPVAERARLVLLDTVGVCLRGSETDYVAEAAESLGALGAGAIVGTGAAGSGVDDGAGATAFARWDRRPVATAALLNAAGGTTLELDEGNQRSAHPGIHTVPPAVAAAEHLGASGEDLLGALVAGYEVGARLGDVIRPMKDGLHPHGEWAPAAGAVAVGRLRGLDADGLAETIRISVTPFVATHWEAALSGATVRNFYAGVCCAHGVTAAALAEAGVTGVDGAVEECLLPYTAGREITDGLLDAAFGTLGESYYLTSSYFKVHAACRYAHAPVEALSAIDDRAALDVDRIERIRVETFELGTLLDERRPENVLGAKFSTPYVLAARAVTGRSDAEAFSEELVADERIRALAERVDVVATDEFDARAAEGEWGARVTVAFDDGRRESGTVRDARGGGDDPFAREEVLAKFDALASSVVGDCGAAALRDRLFAVDEAADASTLFAPFRE